MAKSTRKYNAIKKELEKQLERNHTSGQYYTDLIDDYMSLWVTKEKLFDDIMLRGVTVKYDNGGGQSGTKKNESVDQALKVNSQMLKILDALGIKPDGYAGDDDEL